MRPIRMGVIFEQQIQVGGGYQQALNAALLCKELPPDLVEVVFFTTLEENLESLKKYDINANFVKHSFLAKVIIWLHQLFNSVTRISIKFLEPLNLFENIFLKEQIDLIYFLCPSGKARYLNKINYIITVWDLCHRDNPEFPEVRWNGQFEKREDTFLKILSRAVGVLVDSPIGKINVIKRYSINAERVHVMPFQAAVATRCFAIKSSLSVDINEKYELRTPYIFYPAQFWPHKNHVYLLEGLKILEQRYSVYIGAIFSGSDQGNLSYIKRYVVNLGLQDRVRIVGFVPSEELPELYRQSLALVMPTYFGPTNLPPLEAFELGVPVLYPDKDGLRQQVGDAALLMDLKDPNTMAQHLANLVNDNNLRNHLVQKGKERLLTLNQADRVYILKNILNDFRWRRMCWE